MVARVIDHPFGSGVIPTPYNPDPALLAIVEIIRDGLIRDQHVRLHKFGTFRLRWSKQRQIKHPKTGATMTVAPVPRITFTPAKHLQTLIDPDRKPCIPLDDTANSHPSPRRTTPKAQPIRPTIHGNKDSHKRRQPAADSDNLRESVQDIIDEHYTAPGINTGRIPHQADDTANTDIKSRKTWALGLLAAIPLILALLQADFTADNDTAEGSSKPAEVNTATTQATQEITQLNPPGSHSREMVSNKPRASAHPEQATRPFYLSPQLHNVQAGENLWKLAERFYGDALLWPHIFRANMRTLNDPDKISAGQALVIPGLQQAPDQLSPKDKELVTEGYYAIYQLNRKRQSPQAIYFLMGARQYSFEWLISKQADIPAKDWNIIRRKPG